MAFNHVAVIKFHGHLVFILILWLQAALLMVVSSSYNISKPGCKNKCGNISVPYPFGIGDENCFLGGNFSITCDETFNPPKAFFGDRKLIDIDLHGQLRAKFSVPSDCYDYYSENQTTSSSISNTSLDGASFTFSSTRNKMVAIGCDTVAYIRGASSISGCISSCNSMESVINVSCTGIGCCQTSIPTEMVGYSIELTTQYNHTRIWNLNPCSYAFLVEDNWFNFSSLDLFKNQKRSEVPVVIDWEVPVVIDWAIGYETSAGYETCEEAKKNLTGTNYTCGVNSDCYDPYLKNGIGYRCKCLDGYEGNPYLINGCQDIDECDGRERLCAPEALCHNTVGNYTCACPSGYYGDGKKQGFGCKRKHAIRMTLFGIGIGIMLVLLLAFAFFWLYRRLQERKQIKLKQRYFKKNGGLLLKQKISSHDGGMEKDKIFVIEELEKATDNFNQSRIIGKGGFGTVYKGMLSDGTIVAIKKSKLVDESQVDQFINEVAILSQIIHRHVVKLLGCCLETHVPLLVYEYVSNGTLSQHLHSKGYVSSISWKDRLRIATEIARALAYMHSEASIPIFHRDIKSCNILLDETYRAKVSDFGLSRSVPIDKTHLTTLVQGTFGYLDPEYFHSCQFTDKSDVYSFGVVLAELLTGERAVSLVRSEEEKGLAMYFVSFMKENRLFEIIESRVVEEGDKDEVMIVAKLAKRCLKLNGKKRPFMKEVAASLERLQAYQQQPLDQPKLQEKDFLVGETSSCWATSGTMFEADDYDETNSSLAST